MLLVTFFFAAFAVLKSDGLLTYDQNKEAIDEYFCLYKDEGNHVHPGGACDTYIACGAGCKTATPGNFKQLCLQNIMPCPAGLFFDENYIPTYLKTQAEKDAYKARNLGGCDYKENSHCLQYQSEVCYGAKNNKHGSFTPASTGTVTKLKLYHHTGSVKCNKARKYSGYWGGCRSQNRAGRPINVWITADRNFNKKKYDEIKEYVKFPVPSVAITASRNGFYGLDDFKDKDEAIFYYSSAIGDDSVYFNSYNECRVYYGEDLFDRTTGDNSGEHCIYIYASFYKG